MTEAIEVLSFVYAAMDSGSYKGTMGTVEPHPHLSKRVLTTKPWRHNHYIWFGGGEVKSTLSTVANWHFQGGSCYRTCPTVDLHCYEMLSNRCIVWTSLSFSLLVYILSRIEGRIFWKWFVGEVKVSLSLCLTKYHAMVTHSCLIKHNAMKTY